jgi:hypothetical protein
MTCPYEINKEYPQVNGLMGGFYWIDPEDPENTHGWYTSERETRQYCTRNSSGQHKHWFDYDLLPIKKETQEGSK